MIDLRDFTQQYKISQCIKLILKDQLQWLHDTINDKPMFKKHIKKVFQVSKLKVAGITKDQKITITERKIMFDVQS